ncbi:MAG TPA: 4-(cytidine 5'-diphospho)-2-C-methyl-D-erythritol kinase [Actinomycetota bacterium]|nr:4-(cytidine 5'-diphospho)-2-C-methyl-D-erythritol kinase [Actinomycetota bacterium]
MSGALRVEAHAKVNVFLRVLRAREDGYHDLASLVLPISLSDVVTVRPARELRVDVRGSLAGDVPPGGLNLALIAALALAEASAGTLGATIVIEKSIPVAAGLGGGSADAAATLVALNELWGCGLHADALADIGARVGSDLPALLVGGPVLVGGRGQRVEPAKVERLWWVLVPFDFPTRSPEAYRWWDEDGGGTGPSPWSILDAAERGDAETLGPLLFNDLERPVVRRHPEIGEAQRALVHAGALGAVMSGSGPTVLGLARDEEHARAIGRGFPGSIVASGPP